MRRRDLIKVGMMASAASTMPMPAVARSAPDVHWRLASAFPKLLPIIFGAAEHFARNVLEATDGRFRITPSAAGEIAPALKSIDAVSEGTVECAQAPLYFLMGREPALAIGTGIPFGLNARHQHAWWTAGGGAEMVNDALAPFNAYALVAGNSGTQMGGWFRKAIAGVEDLNGLRFRIGGMGGDILARLGVRPTMTAAGDIRSALDQGTIDAAEFIGPFDDERLGLHHSAKTYYCPGWWEGGAMLHIVFNRHRWLDLPERYRSVLRQAAEATNNWMLARYDRDNAAALARLIRSGVSVRQFPRPVVDACWTAAGEHYAELARTNERFREMFESYISFRTRAYSYWRVAEHAYDTMMLDLVDRRG